MGPWQQAHPPQPPLQRRERNCLEEASEELLTAARSLMSFQSIRGDPAPGEQHLPPGFVPAGGGSAPPPRVSVSASSRFNGFASCLHSHRHVNKRSREGCGNEVGEAGCQVPSTVSNFRGGGFPIHGRESAVSLELALPRQSS